MIVIFEGADGTGKTEIAKGLSTSLDIPYFRMDTQHENWRNGKFVDALRFDQTYISSFLRQTKHDVIIDRAYPSEWVYSKVFGRETDDILLERIDEEFASMGASIILTLRRDFTGVRHDEIIPRRKLEEIQTCYVDFMGWTRCNVIAIYVDDFMLNTDLQCTAILGKLHGKCTAGMKYTLENRCSTR